ncbi:MAG: hypothetical protein NTV01_02700, partial [Bacteroidia bacterium]|nr:hypothetical protein [Bacteroidia bacterium]
MVSLSIQPHLSRSGDGHTVTKGAGKGSDPGPGLRRGRHFAGMTRDCGGDRRSVSVSVCVVSIARRCSFDHDVATSHPRTNPSRP